MASGPAAMLSVLRQRDFALFWLGQGISMVGDQFYFIALPWLVLKLTGDAVAMGTVLALELVPSALFMLFGGALADRFSPRWLMLLSTTGRMLFGGLLAVLVLQGDIALWMLYAFALVFGVASGFFWPARLAIIPRLAPAEKLQAANALMEGTAQLCVFIGPALAGLLIAAYTGEDAAGRAAASPAAAAPDLGGIGIAFAIDTLTFLAALIALALVRIGATAAAEEQQESLLDSVRLGLRYVWRDPALCIWFLILSAINLSIGGPLTVGIPVLADMRLEGGATAFGTIISAFGGGLLLGTLLAGVLPRPPASIAGSIILFNYTLFGFGLAALGLVTSTLPAALAVFVGGGITGHGSILFTTWLHLRTPPAMLGRVMSLLMLAVVSMRPLSYAVAGILVSWSLSGLFFLFGGLLVSVALLGALNPRVRAMSIETEQTV